MAAVPTLPNFVDGIVPTSQFTQLVTAVDFAMNPPSARLRQTSAQSIPNSTLTVINFGVADLDSESGWDVGTPSQYVAVYAGWHWVSGGCGFASNATANRACSIRVNGSDLPGTQGSVGPIASASSQPLLTAELVYLNVGDYVELVVIQTSGGALNTAVVGTQQPRLNVVRLRS